PPTWHRTRSPGAPNSPNAPQSSHAAFPRTSPATPYRVSLFRLASVTTDHPILSSRSAPGAVASWFLRRHFVISVVLLVLFFFPLLWISQYNYPEGDDFATFFQANTLGPLKATKWLYFHWTGRYTTFFFQTLFQQFDAWLVAYKVIPVFVLVVGFVCLGCFTRAFLGPALRRTESFTFAAILYIFLVSLTPAPATAFYCLSTNILYTGAVFVTLIIFALWIGLERASQRSTRVALSMTVVVLIALLSGLNEISSVLLIATLGFINCYQVVCLRRVPRRYLLFLVVSI